MKVTTPLILGVALLGAAPVAAQDNAASNDTVAAAPANEAVATDMNVDANMPAAAPAPEAAAPEAAPAENPPPPPANRGFPWGVLGVLGLIGLLGARKAKS